MDTELAPGSGVKPPPIPSEGLGEVLRAWTGRGQLLKALALVQDEGLERQWARRDIERRANRVLYEEILPLLNRWPKSAREWLDVIPAESLKQRMLTTSPASASWTETRRLGWPPRVYVSKSRRRIADTMLISLLKWTVEAVVRLREDATVVDPNLMSHHKVQVDQAASVLTVDPIVFAQAEVPTRVDLVAAASEGRPWPAVVAVARRLKELDDERLEVLAERLLKADLDWRLFHLGVLGLVLAALREAKLKVMSLRPLAGAAAGPAYRVTTGEGIDWDLWFEGAGAWKHYGVDPPYRVAVSGLSGTSGSLGPDLLLILKGVAALIVECKYPRDWSSEYVGRQGYSQVAAYAVDTRAVLAPVVEAVVVGPEGVVSAASHSDTLVGRLGVAPPSGLGEKVLGFMSDHP